MPAAVDASTQIARSTLVRTGGRVSGGVDFEREMVGFFVEAAEMLGVPKSVAAIYGICFASAEPLSFADIEQRLDVSAGSISQGLRILREVGALKPISVDRDRREFFEPDLHLRRLAVRWLEQRLQKQLASGKDRLKSVSKTIPAGRSGSAKILRSRVKTLQGWSEQASAVLPIVKTFLKL